MLTSLMWNAPLLTRNNSFPMPSLSLSNSKETLPYVLNLPLPFDALTLPTSFPYLEKIPLWDVLSIFLLGSNALGSTLNPDPNSCSDDAYTSSVQSFTDVPLLSKSAVALRVTLYV